MAGSTQPGQIVWHDLMTADVAVAKRFYGSLLGWDFHIEHATDFVWNPGEPGDYPLIMAGGEAHGGVVETGGAASHWLPWISVDDVDAAVSMAQRCGGRIEREPFETPGVGRGAVVRDPRGARICPFLAAHPHPPPTGTFVWEVLAGAVGDPVAKFYEAVFGWKLVEGEREAVFRREDRQSVASASTSLGELGVDPGWIPICAVEDLPSAQSRAAQMDTTRVARESIPVAGFGDVWLIQDPTGAWLGLGEASPSG